MTNNMEGISTTTATTSNIAMNNHITSSSTLPSTTTTISSRAKRLWSSWFVGTTLGIVLAFVMTHRVMFPRGMMSMIQDHHAAGDNSHQHMGSLSAASQVEEARGGLFPKHAAEALLCRDSVVNFVINATDGKDECEGLKKAYDKTCSSYEAQQQQPKSPLSQQSSPEFTNRKGDPSHTPGSSNPIGHKTNKNTKLVTNRAGTLKKSKPKSQQGQGLHSEKAPPLQPRAPHSGRRHARRQLASRRLWEKTTRTFQWRRLWYEFAIAIWDNYLRPLFQWGADDDDASPFFFAEDAVAGIAWDRAAYVVRNGFHHQVHADLRRQWAKEHEHRLMLEAEAADSVSMDNTTSGVPPTALGGTSSTATSGSNTMKSLDLPTANQHISGQTLTDTVFLHQSEQLLELLSNNQSLTTTSTNGIQDNKAAQEAAAAAKALSDTTAALSAIFSDPTSMEAVTCCGSILNVYHENCSSNDEEELSDSRLFFVVLVMAMCGMVKSLIRHFRILWLPEAAGCILVGVLSGYILMFFPRQNISFDGNWFLRIMVPPIIFEAALSIDKKSFNRHLVPILLYAVVGTLVATILTAVVVHRGTALLGRLCPTIPYVEALTFGALISSIDPIAVLSVLSNMGMTDTDTIYVVIFGESLLNDGVSIVLFQTLVNFLDETLYIDQAAVAAAAVHFCVVALGSLLIGVASGMTSTIYYWLFNGCQTPLVEVLMFFCWALLPYYVCDGIGWSGIVAAVATGFVMDLNIVGQRNDETRAMDGFDDSSSSRSDSTSRATERGRRRIFSPEGHLSEEARTHIGFVTEIIATIMETAIFAYLGLFLFSHRYHWNFFHVVIAILACCLSRAIMIPIMSLIGNWTTRLLQYRATCRTSLPKTGILGPAGVIVDKKMQVVLWFAGLRGAMSFALVEHIPLYDDVNREGTRFKPELKAMTSASIMFTVFVLGGYTYYMMQRLGIAPSTTSKKSVELVAHLAKESQMQHHDGSLAGVSPVEEPLTHNASHNVTRQRRVNTTLSDSSQH